LQANHCRATNKKRDNESHHGETGRHRILPRTRVRNDNPFSEALLRTCKYRPDWPTKGFADSERFLTAQQSICTSF
jgi:hypothetical protein